MKTDVHTHLIPKVSRLAAEAASLRADGNGWLWDGGKRIGFPRLYDPNELVSWLDAVGLDQALVSIPPLVYRQNLGEGRAAIWVRAMNDALIEELKGSDRMMAFGYLPLEHAELALAEARRLVTLGVVGFCGSAGGGSLPLDSTSLRPLWKYLNDRDLPILLHPGLSADRRMGKHYLSNLLGNPAETGLAAGQLILGGVIAEFPQLRICLVHCGGVTLSVLGRWQRGVDTDRPGLVRRDINVWAEAGNLWVDTLGHDPRMLPLALETFGRNHMLLGSDWPFPMGDDDPLRAVEHLGERMLEMVACENPRNFLNLKDSRQ